MYIKPKKSLGQNFLIDKNIQKKIVRACDLSKDDIVLEIGAGRGDLTLHLAKVAKKVYALEIDPRLYPLLGMGLMAYDNCQVICADILKFDIHKFVEENKIKQKIKVIGNIPYYISSPIIQHLITYRNDISAAFLTVQKEFAQRAKAIPGSKVYGSFSCFVQYYCQCKMLFEIRRNCFLPVPNVDSGFLSFEFRRKPLFLVQDEEKFFKLIRTAFNQRRKTLRNSLSGLVAEEKLDDFFQKFGVDKNIRPESLSLEQFAGLNNLLNSSN
jgi:16S rRNA (adenine1518-N6/adenine1519-N6)-dimethyltransferase